MPHTLSPECPTATRRTYTVAEPTEHDARTALAEVVGPDEAARSWARARAAAGVPGGALTLETLWRVAQALASEGGMVAVTARSLGIRIRSYVLLQQRQERP